MIRFQTLDEDVKVIKFKGDADSLERNVVYEVRGIVNKDNSLSFGELTKYGAQFDLDNFESMLHYYHGLCRTLCVK